MRLLIVGQGLAGTLISHRALQLGWDAHVIDAGLPSASAVAAGMFNPMSFRRIVEVWEAEKHLRCMTETYRDLEGLLGVPLMHALPIHKCLPNEAYAAEWRKKAQSLRWLTPATDTHLQTGAVEGGGWIDLPLLLSAWRERLASAGRFEQRHLAAPDRSALQAGQWDALVDCRGVHIKEDTTLTPLDIRVNRGELLTISASAQAAPPGDSILNFGKWTIPLGHGTWRLGASYEWNRNDLDTTDATGELLISKLSNQLGADPSDFNIEAHHAGLRPVSRDRRPAVGLHPGARQWYVFNGLGTRGVLIGPRWARYLCDLMNGKNAQNTVVQPSRLSIQHS